MSAKYKLIYFELKGRAEVSRMLFGIAGQEFEDVRLSFEEWPSVKPKLPFQQAPVLEVTEDGKSHQIAQSHSIERFLANRFNLLGKTDIEGAQVDMICEEILDIFISFVMIYFKPDSDEKTKELDEAFKGKIPNGLKLIQNLLEANKSGFLVGDGLTLADLQLVNFYDYLRDRKNEILEKLPALKKHDEMIRALPKVAEHLKKNANLRLATFN